MNNRQAFSLIEMTIVLTIIGVIFTGVTIGQKLIKNNQLNQVISEVRLHHSNMDIFKLKFAAYAGDYADAALIWGNDCNDNSLGIDECSGDGDDIIVWSLINEQANSWAHIYRAKINNSFYPFSSADTWQDNVPESALDNGSLYLFISENGKVILQLRSRQDEYSALAHIDAYYIDNKIDDGLLATGNIYGECGASITTYDKDYGDALVCGLKFY